jgi:hypothetical protein
VLTNVRTVAEPIVVGHLGGETLLRRAGSLQLGCADGIEGVVLNDVFSIDSELLPAGVFLLIGVGDIRHLGISLDAVLACPECPWEQAVHVGFFTRCARRLRSIFSRARPPALATEARVYLDSETVPLMHRAPQHFDDDVAATQRRTPRYVEAERGARSALLEATKERLIEEQRMRGAARIADLVQESRMRAAAVTNPPALRRSHPRGTPARNRRAPVLFGLEKGPNFMLFGVDEQPASFIRGKSVSGKQKGWQANSKASLQRRMQSLTSALFVAPVIWHFAKPRNRAPLSSVARRCAP